jgi:hypothetical protein
MHNFTSEDLIQYLYAETSIQKTAAIKAALENDYSLREEFETLSAAHSQLETVKLSPRKQTIENILKYAEDKVAALSENV